MLQHVADSNPPDVIVIDAIDARKARATYDDLVQVPDHLTAEIIDGELHISLKPTPRHQRAASSLGALLIPPFDHGHGGPGGWWILGEPELHIGSDVVVPDLAGWRQERMPRLPELAYFPDVPDWVCEILSPSTTWLDRNRKLPLYARMGVSHVWVIHPIDRRLEVFGLEGSKLVRRAVFSGQEHVRAAPFDAIVLQLPLLWPKEPASH